MEFRVQLFLRQHHDGFFSIEVVGEPELCVYAETLEQAREDLELILGDRIERSHPRHLSRYAVASSLRHEELELAEALSIQGEEGPRASSSRVSVIIERDRRWQRMWFPRWDARHWIPAGVEVSAEAAAFLGGYLKKMTEHSRLGLRWERSEWIEELTVEAEPAGPSAFTGKYLGVSMLPVPGRDKKGKGGVDDRAGDEGDEDDEEEVDDLEQNRERSRADKRRKKKRPPTPTFQRIATPLSKLARGDELERAFGRQREVEELVAMLQAAGPSIVAVVGESGVGKTTILNELVYRIRDKSSPAQLRTRPVFFADASRLIAGRGFFGDWQRQCLDLVQEAIDAEVIWYVGPLLPLLDAGKSLGSEQNVSLILKPYLAAKRITLIGECTEKAWAQLELRDPGFARLFGQYRVEEPGLKESRTILASVARELADETAISVDDDGLLAIEELCRRYHAEGSPLGASIHFLRRLVDEALAAEYDSADREDDVASTLGRAEVVARFCAETGLPAFLIRDDEPLDPEATLMHFRKRLIGQDEAVRRMTDLVSVMKAGLSDLGRPLGSFLFVGPTGVGKTEMAKALAEYLFGRRDRLLRFDMSEFVSADSVHRFLGDAGQEGQLIADIRRSPFTVLLLDEIEKAHPAVFDVLLQVLGEARLTDQAGRTADFRNAVVLMTSNLGVETFKQGVGFGGRDSASFRQHFLAEAERFFRPEFINRIDYIVPFMPLEAPAIAEITRRELAAFLDREGIRQRELEVELPEAVYAWLAGRGVDARYGARPLKRVIERDLTAGLARHLSDLGPAPRRRVRAEVVGDVLEFANLPPGKGGKDKSARGTLTQLIGEIAVIRYQTQRWLECSPFQEMCQSIRLLDRLSQDRNFWNDKRFAEQRLRRSEAARELKSEFEDLCSHLGSLEDLAYELYYDRNIEPVAMLAQELAEYIDKLGRLELSLYGRRFRHPDRAVLYLEASANAQDFLRDLIKLYVELGRQQGWTIKARSAFESPDAAGRAAPPPPTRKKRSADRGGTRAAQKKGRRKDGAGADDAPQGSTGDGGTKMRDRYERNPLAWSWDSPVTIGPDESEASQRRFLQAAYPGGETSEMCALVFEGEHAACFLSAESGLHLCVDNSETRQVKVRFAELGDEFLEPVIKVSRQWNHRRRRAFRIGKRIVEDLVLGIHYPLAARYAPIYRRFMMNQIYDSVFGPGAHTQFVRR